MKTLIFSFVFMISGLALADQTTHFSQLLTDYDHGTLPKLSDVQGFWSGRCYGSTNQNTPVASALVAENLSYIPLDDGPAFPAPTPVHSFILAAMEPASAPENFYDNPSQDTMKGLLESVTDLRKLSVSVSENSLSSELFPVKFSVRKFSNYFVLNAVFSASGIFEGPFSGPASLGETGFVCYYFKKIHE